MNVCDIYMTVNYVARFCQLSLRFSLSMTFASRFRTSFSRIHCINKLASSDSFIFNDDLAQQRLFTIVCLFVLGEINDQED